MLAKVSIIIPARNEPYLQKTIDGLLNTSKGEIEIIVVLDGYWPVPPMKNYSNVTLIHFSESIGMRPAINAAARIAKGKYLMKCDAHCLFDEGFDIKLVKDCEPDWTVVPRRYGLDVGNWTRTDKLYEFQYIRKSDLKGKDWSTYAERVEGQQIVDLMTSQGSCWFMYRDRFWELGGLDAINYGTMGREAQEVCLKTWLSGGRYVLNRNTWYAHWSKGKGEMAFHVSRLQRYKSKGYAMDLWLNDKWSLQKRKMEWLIEKFAPVPTWEGKERLINTIEMAVANPVKYIHEKYKLDSRESPIKIEGMNRIDMYGLFAELGFKNGCEIGVWAGVNAENIFESIPGVKMFLVDPYRNYEYSRKPRREDKIRSARKRAHNRMDGKNAVFFEMLSEDAIRKIPDGSLDFAYIDAEHTYDMAMLDIILWNRKVRKGGVLSGHDYYCDPRHNMQVKTAVNDYAKAHGISPFYITENHAEPPGRGRTTSWFWIKQ